MNVKAGDLAIVTWAAVPENTGRIVEVLAFHGADVPPFNPRRDDYWHVRIVGSKARNLLGAITDYGFAADAYLRPVSGLPIEEDANIKERVPA